MIVSARFKKALTLAKKDGKEFVAITRGRNWNNTAYVWFSIDELLSKKDGTNMHVPRYGTFVKSLDDNDIPYQMVFDYLKQ